MNLRIYGVTIKNGSICINGKIYYGKHVSIINGRVCVDGKFKKKVKGIVRVDISGNLTSLRTDADVEIKGHVSGNLMPEDLLIVKMAGGTIDAGGSVSCGDVEGNVDAGGSVRCRDVIGDVDAGGSITHRS